MSAWVLVVQPQAERDIFEIGERIEAIAGRRVALDWALAFERAIRNLSENPYLGAESDLIGHGRRRLVIRPYLVVYRVIEPNIVRIVRIVDGRRELPILLSIMDD